MKKTKEMLVLMLFTIILLTIPTLSQAALQANGSGSSTKSVDGWMSSIRQMESQGGTLGLTGSASLNQQPGEDGKLADSNNLDIHMQKNTEYGAMAILSASSYGKSTPVHVTTDGSLSTTTGNKSGVYMSLNKEWVAAGQISYSTTYKNANLKYRNPYTTARKSLPGDATFECQGWHNTGTNVSSDWFNRYDCSAVLRANSGSIFSFHAFEGTNWDNGDIAYYGKKWASRAVVVLGARTLKYNDITLN